MSKSQKNGKRAPRAKLSADRFGKYKVAGRVGGSGQTYIEVGEHDEVPFVFQRFERDQREKERAVVMRIDTGEIGMLPDWGLLRVKLQSAREVPNPDRSKRKSEPTVGAPAQEGDAFVLLTHGKERMKKGRYRGKPAVALDLYRLER